MGTSILGRDLLLQEKPDGSLAVAQPATGHGS